MSVKARDTAIGVTVAILFWAGTCWAAVAVASAIPAWLWLAGLFLILGAWVLQGLLGLVLSVLR